MGIKDDLLKMREGKKLPERADTGVAFQFDAPIEVREAAEKFLTENKTLKEVSYDKYRNFILTRMNTRSAAFEPGHTIKHDKRMVMCAFRELIDNNVMSDMFASPLSRMDPTGHYQPMYDKDKYSCGYVRFSTDEYKFFINEQLYPSFFDKNVVEFRKKEA